MPAPIRALCAELDVLLNDISSTHPNLSENGVKVINDLSDRTRAMLAEPEESKLSLVTNCTFSGPPQALIESWRDEIMEADFGSEVNEVLLKVYQAGANQELKACCDAIYDNEEQPLSGGTAEWLRSVRRPKSPSLKEQALESLSKIEDNNTTYLNSPLIRRPLECPRTNLYIKLI